ncbi:MAG: AI-2E family transporter [Rhodobacteraceae bacterium]|nr:AI-2E family transporter [Paracoccaceae bacterium]
MTLRRQMFFWLLALAAFIVFMTVFASVLLPFVAGMAVAYLLDPVCDWLESLGLGRLSATLLILFSFVLILILFFVSLVPLLGGQLVDFVDNLPRLAQALQKFLTDKFGDSSSWLIGFDAESLKSHIVDLAGKGANVASELGKSLWSGGQALLSVVSLFVVTPVVAFYLLLDWDNMVERIDSWVPRDHQETVRELAREMDMAVAGFVRGQTSVCLTLGLFYAVALVIAGLNFGLLIGIVAGLLSFIPFVGAAVGFVVSIGVAFFQFWPDWIMVAVIAVIFGVGQFLEGNILQPKFLGDSTGLHPVTLMFALFAFGYLFGFVGMLIAVPAAAILGVLARFALKQYLASAVYKGSHGDRPVEGE